MDWRSHFHKKGRVSTLQGRVLSPFTKTVREVLDPPGEGGVQAFFSEPPRMRRTSFDAVGVGGAPEPRARGARGASAVGLCNAINT